MAMRRFKGLAVAVFLGAALGLGACDMVVSPTPVFSAEESAQAPRLKPGFWAFDACVVPGERASSLCRDGYVISDETLAPAQSPPGGYGAAGGGDYTPPPYPYRVGVGDPLLLQVRLEEIASDRQGHPFYVFVAVDPKSRDDQGRIDRAEIWLVKCGPAAEPRPGDMGPRPTEQLLPGVTATDYGCRPTDRPGLFTVARASRGLAANEAHRAVYRWIAERPPEPAAKPPE